MINQPTSGFWGTGPDARVAARQDRQYRQYRSDLVRHGQAGAFCLCGPASACGERPEALEGEALCGRPGPWRGRAWPPDIPRDLRQVQEVSLWSAARRCKLWSKSSVLNESGLRLSAGGGAGARRGGAIGSARENMARLCFGGLRAFLMQPKPICMCVVCLCVLPLVTNLIYTSNFLTRQLVDSRANVYS